MRKKIVAGNWKMNHTLPQTLAFIETVKKNLLKQKAIVHYDLGERLK